MARFINTYYVYLIFYTYIYIYIFFFFSNGVRSSPDAIRDNDRNKSSPSMVNVPHSTPVVNRMAGPPPVLPNLSQLPPGYNPQTMQPMGAHFGE